MKNPIRRAMTLLTVIAMMLAGTALPAFAVAQGNATITEGADLLSGQADQDVVIQVSNTGQSTNGGLPIVGSTASNIDLVQVVPPEDLFDTGEFTRANFTGPEGWTAFVQSNIIRFRADEGAELAPGESGDFTLNLDVLGQPSDAAGNFFVSVSDDDGRVLTTAGVPSVVVRTLQVVTDSIEINKPSIASVQNGNFVTEQQDNAVANVMVSNIGTQPQTVTPRIEKASGSSNVSQNQDPEDARNINSGQTRRYEVPVTFGNPGDLVLKATASSSEGSDALEMVDDDNITVQQRIQLDYVGSSLAPRGINPDSTPSPAFTVQLNKFGGPGSNPGATDLNLSINGLETDTSVTLPSGPTNNISVTFPALNISSLADGTYTPELDYAGIDANGADIVPEVESLDDILLDRLNAIVNIALNPPASAVDYPGIVDAASFGDDVGVSGNVTRGGDACGDCEVTSAVAKVNGREIPEANVSVSVGADGSVSGTVTMPDGSPENLDADAGDEFTYQAGDNQVTLDVTIGRVVDGIESPNAGAGNAQAPVDIIRPTLAPPVGSLPATGTVTGRDGNGDFVDIIFTEPVNFGQFGSSPTDWLVDGGTVASVEYPDNGETSNSAQATDRIRLRLLEELPNNATPTATYDPQGLLRPTGFDRVELAFSTPDDVIVADGIAPDALDLLTLSTFRQGAEDSNDNRVDQGPVGGDFVTRDTSPELVVADVLVGDTVTVFADTDGDGVQDSGERTLGTKANNGMEARDLSITLGNLGGEGTINLGAYATDANANRGVSLTGFTLTLDQTNIMIEDFSISGNNITVTMTEAITTLDGFEGRDFAIDWFVFSEGRWRPTNDVTNDGDATTRTLSVDNDSVPDPSSITRVRYEYVNFGEERVEEERYLDRALNEMVDGFLQK